MIGGVVWQSIRSVTMKLFVLVMVIGVIGFIVVVEIFMTDTNRQRKYILQGNNYIPDRVTRNKASNKSKDLIKIPNLPTITYTEDELPLYPSNMIPTDGNWQTVNTTTFKFYVFSAFFERRNKWRSVRIIAVTRTKSSERDHVWCRLWSHLTYNSTTYTSRTIAGKIKVIHEANGGDYSASFVLCPIQAKESVPAAVSIVTNVFNTPDNLLLVNDNYNGTIPTNKFGVCLEPVFNKYNKAIRVMEFLELNSILGVSHFTVYNNSIGPQVNCILKDYEARQMLTILPWELDMPTRKDIWVKGIFAALNDCLYRSMYRFSHILVIDIDEYIIPRHNYTLSQLIDYMGTKRNKKTTGSYNLRNAFFYLQRDNDKWVDNSTDPFATSLFTQTKTKRQSKLYPYRIRSKYICRPEVVVEIGNHFVWEFIPGYGKYDVPDDIAILHHYREDCVWNDPKCLKAGYIIDTTALRYHRSLADVVKKHFLNIKDKCNLEDLSATIRPTI